jgi:YihY family inner membrane protein
MIFLILFKEKFFRCLHRVWSILWATICKYIETDGELRAASFAYYAFFALFPLILLFISLGARIWEQQEVVNGVLNLLTQYMPVGVDQKNVILDTINGVVSSRSEASAVAIFALAWSALRFFQALVQGVNRAWGTSDYSWWRLPLANLLMVVITASTLLLGVVAPVIMRAVEAYWHTHTEGLSLRLLDHSFHLARLILPSIVLMYGLLMFYKYAPRRKTTLREVWVGALFVTIALQVVSKGFVVYAVNFGKFNALYGTLSSVVAVLMWIYLSGSVIIFGGCLCAAKSEVENPSSKKGSLGNSGKN